MGKMTKEAQSHRLQVLRDTSVWLRSPIEEILVKGQGSSQPTILPLLLGVRHVVK